MMLRFGGGKILFNGTENIGVPWQVATGFIRLMSNPSVLASSLPGSEATDLVTGWFSHGHIAPIDPGVGYLSHFRELLSVTGAGGNLVPDAHIAGLAIEHDAEVHTHNSSDFGRFPGVRWHNPLA